MLEETFQALVVDKAEDGSQASFQELPVSALPEGDVTIAVAYSSLNYKDGLAVTGKGKALRRFPMVPGIDLAGTVEKSDLPAFAPGREVVLTGWGVGEQFWGGFAQKARVKSEWLLPLPKGLSLKHAMTIGTAGLTAMLSVMALEERGVSREGEIAVTGAAGGVGSMAVAILAKLGYRVVASTGRTETYDYLKALGAQDILPRETLSAPSDKPMETGRWSGAVDSVGGDTLAGLLRTMAYGGCVAACGLAGGNALHTTVFPFILRGVSLIGIESPQCPQERRRAAWTRLARVLSPEALDLMTQVIPLREVPAFSQEILQGKVRGRIVVDVNG